MKITQVACGGMHTAIMLDDGSVSVFGYNKDNQCDVPNLLDNKVISISCGGRHTALLTQD